MQTPFKTDLSPDAQACVRHCQWLINSEVGLAVFGTNSEANLLTVRAQRYLLDALLEAGVPATCLMPGTGCCLLMDTVELTRHATRAGVGGVLMRFCRNKRKPQSSACLISARVRLLVPCARCSFSSTSRWK